MLGFSAITLAPHQIPRVPLHFTNLKKEDIQHVVDKLIKRVAGWRGKLLSSARKLTLLKSCRASIPIYLLPVIKFPKWGIFFGMIVKRNTNTIFQIGQVWLRKRNMEVGGYLT